MFCIIQNSILFVIYILAWWNPFSAQPPWHIQEVLAGRTTAGPTSSPVSFSEDRWCLCTPGQAWTALFLGHPLTRWCHQMECHWGFPMDAPNPLSLPATHIMHTKHLVIAVYIVMLKPKNNLKNMLNKIKNNSHLPCLHIMWVSLTGGVTERWVHGTITTLGCGGGLCGPDSGLRLFWPDSGHTLLGLNSRHTMLGPDSWYYLLGPDSGLRLFWLHSEHLLLGLLCCPGTLRLTAALAHSHTWGLLGSV